MDRNDSLFIDYVAWMNGPKTEGYDSQGESLLRRLQGRFKANSLGQRVFLSEVKQEVERLNRREEEISRVHSEALEENRKYDARVRNAETPVISGLGEQALLKSKRDRAFCSRDYMEFVRLCDESGYSPDGKAEEDAYKQGCFLIEQESQGGKE